jgi:cation diffusion facilitator CzcD-associated flavoprotein CzcO
MPDVDHTAPRPTEACDAIVIGGGPAGLSTARRLERAGVRAVVIEAGDLPGRRWHEHYDRLRLHTARPLSGLPGRRLPRTAGRWVPRASLADYLVTYAQGLDVRTGAAATGVDRDGSGWSVTLADGTTLHASTVVVCTGRTNEPVLPQWGTGTLPNGTVVHSRDYRNGSAYFGHRVLVVGAGNTGAEIALDLVDHGAAQVLWSIRSGQNVIGRTIRGIPVQYFSLVGRRLPTSSRDRTFRLLSRLSVGDAAGIPRPAFGGASQFDRTHTTPLIDVGTVAAVRRGDIEVVRDVSSLDGSTVHFSDGHERTVDAIVLATGYRPGLMPLVGHLGVLDTDGYPRHFARVDADNPGLYFVGFANAVSGLLREISMEARRVARAERARRRGTPSGPLRRRVSRRQRAGVQGGPRTATR